MPNPKSSPSKPRADQNQDTFTAELTSGQLAFGVCILILFGMACFMLGVLIGRYQPSERQQVASLASSQSEADQEADQSGAQPSPDRADTAPEKRRSVVEVPPPPARRNRPETPEEPDVQRRGSPSKQTGAKADATPPKPLPKGPDPDKPAPSRVTVSLAKPVKKDPAKVASVPVSTPPSRPAVKKPEAPAPPAARSDPGAGSFTVQIGVFSERKNAEAAQRTLELKTRYKVELLPVAGGTKTLVAVGRFPDRASALRARDELRAKHGYKDCFIKKREGASLQREVSQSPTAAPGVRRPNRVIKLRRPEV